MARTKSGQTWYGLDQIRSNSARWPEGLEKTAFFDSFWQFFVLFFAFSPKIYITKRYSEKKLGLSCFFLWQEPLIQKSAAPQGSPPPTQQISEIQLSWAINYGLGRPVPSDPFVLQEYQRPSTLRSTEHMHANLSDVQSRGHHLQEYPITGGPLHSTGGMHAYKIYLVCKADDTLATTCHSLWHCRGFNGLPNPLGPILQIYPNSISTAQGPHKRPEHPSHFHHHYQHLCSTLVRWNFVAHWSHKFMKQLHIGQFIRLVR